MLILTLKFHCFVCFFIYSINKVWQFKMWRNTIATCPIGVILATERSSEWSTLPSNWAYHMLCYETMHVMCMGHHICFHLTSLLHFLLFQNDFFFSKWSIWSASAEIHNWTNRGADKVLLWKMLLGGVGGFCQLSLGCTWVSMYEI